MIGADLRGKAALVTGSSRGIGAAVARGFGQAGMRVAVHYRGARDEAEQVKADIERAGGEAFVLQGDIAEKGMVERLIERKPVADTPDELFEAHMALNVRPVFAACRAAVRQFRVQGGGGAIVNLSSIAARTGGGGGSSLYAGSKAFIATFSRALAKEVAAEGIRVNCVAPGVLATPMQDRTTPPEMLDAIRKQVPLGRIGAAEECVGAFLFLSSEQLSGYLTGQVIEVNGGLLMP